MSRLQAKVLNHDGFFEVMKAVNQFGASHEIDESRLPRAFDRVWLDIEKDLSNVIKPPDVVKPEPNYNKMIEEILTIVRSLPERIPSKALRDAEAFREGEMFKVALMFPNLVRRLLQDAEAFKVAVTNPNLAKMLLGESKDVTPVPDEKKSEPSPSPPIAFDQPSQQS